MEKTAKMLPAIKCWDKLKSKIVFAYHINESGAAHNKKNTLCIGCIGADLIPKREITNQINNPQ